MSQLDRESLSPEAMQFLTALMQGRCNLLVSGDLLADKDGLLDLLTGLIPGGRKVLRVEPGAIQAASAKGDWLEQVAAARPDHVVVTAWSKDDFLDVLRLIGAGDGVVTCIHATSLRGALQAIELLAAQVAPQLTQKTVREHMSRELDVIVHCEGMGRPASIVTNITEVQYMEDGVIVMQDLFLAEKREGGYRFRPTGVRPKLLSQLEGQGIALAPSVFGVSERLFR